MRKNEDHSADFFIRVASAETAPHTHASHPSEDDLLLLLSDDDLATERRSRLHAHLSTCSYCHVRWRTLKSELLEQTNSLEARSTAPSLASTIQGRKAAVGHAASWLRALFETRTLVALGSAAASLALAFLIMIPVLHNASQQTAVQLQSISEELRTLQNQVNTGGLLTNSFSFEAITESALLSYEWETLRAYTISSGDTWRSVARNQLGNESLWPALWVLNAKIATDDSFNAGTVVWLPTLRE